MTEPENEEVIEAPKVSECLEFGGTPDQPRTRDKFWYRAMLSDSDPSKGEGLIIHVARRPRSRRNEDPHPTLRLMRPNPAGILFHKIRSGQVIVENYFDFHNRQVLMKQDMDKKKEAKQNKK